MSNTNSVVDNDVGEDETIDLSDTYLTKLFKNGKLDVSCGSESELSSSISKDNLIKEQQNDPQFQLYFKRRSMKKKRR